MDNVVVWYMLQPNLSTYRTITLITYTHLLQSCGGLSAPGKAKPGVHYRLNARDIPFILGTVRKLFVQSKYMYVHTLMNIYVHALIVSYYVHMDITYECA